MFTITFTEGPRVGQSVVVEPTGPPILTIGRERGCGIRVKDPHVSGKHSQLVIENDVVRIEDLGSINGTWLNGRKIAEPVVLKAGDTVSFGKSTFVVKIEEITSETEEIKPNWKDILKAHAHIKDPWVIGSAAVAVLAVTVSGVIWWKRRAN